MSAVSMRGAPASGSPAARRVPMPLYQARRPGVDDELLAQARRARLGPGQERQPVEELADLVVEPGPGGDLVGLGEIADPRPEHAPERGRVVAPAGGPTRRPRRKRRQREPYDRTGGRPAVGHGRRHRCRSLDLIHHLRRRRNAESERPDEPEQEALVPLVVVTAERLLEQHRMLGEARRRVEVTEVLGQEVREVERPQLRPAELLGQDRVHGPVDDRGFYLGTRVDPDDRGRVVDRVEVVAAGLLVQRLFAEVRPDADLRAVERLVAPLIRVARVRADEDPSVGEDAPVSPQRLDPVPDERHLVRGDELGRADVEHHRLRWVEADLGAELLAGGGRLAAEPLVVGRRTG
jgi:hypothetical protein